ncbi:MAG: hypothetical protein R3F53_03525 [Gammaproteobacteria bacterium]
MSFCSSATISALHGSGIIELLDSVKEAYDAATRKLSTPELTRILEDALASHQPPLVHGHSIKLRYAHQGGQNPPLIIIHGNRTEHVPTSYRRYLSNTYRQVLKLRGTPVLIEFKSSANPYKPSKPKRPQQHRPVKASGPGKKLPGKKGPSKKSPAQKKPGPKTLDQKARNTKSHSRKT